MELSVEFMSNIIGALGIVLYMAAPFLSESKKALYARLGGEGLMGLMFFYIGALPGVSYYLFMIISALFEKKIESNKVFSLVFGIVACAMTVFINNCGVPGMILGLSLIPVYFHVNEQKMLTTAAFMDVITSVALLYFSYSLHSIAGTGFAAVLFLIAMAGLFSAVRLAKGGGLQAAAAEEALYQRQHAKKRNEMKSAKSAKKLKNKKL